MNKENEKGFDFAVNIMFHKREYNIKASWVCNAFDHETKKFSDHYKKYLQGSILGQKSVILAQLKATCFGLKGFKIV